MSYIFNPWYHDNKAYTRYCLRCEDKKLFSLDELDKHAKIITGNSYRFFNSYSPGTYDFKVCPECLVGILIGISQNLLQAMEVISRDAFLWGTNESMCVVSKDYTLPKCETVLKEMKTK